MSLSKINSFVKEVKQTEKIDTRSWKEFKIGDLFDCDTAKQILKVDGGDFPQVNRSAFNNGITKHVKKIGSKVNQKGCITIGAEGYFAFYQEEEFMAGNKIYVLRHKRLTKFNGLFVCAILNSIIPLYSYNNARTLKKIRDEVHKLPIDKDGEPDWEYMQEYMEVLSKNIEKSLN